MSADDNATFDAVLLASLSSGAAPEVALKAARAAAEAMAGAAVANRSPQLAARPDSAITATHTARA